MRTRLILVAVAVAAVTVPAGALAARAPTHIDRFTAKPSLTPGTARYKGKISSEKNRCFQGRRFQIIHRGIVIVEGRTDEDGEFSELGPQPPNGDKVELRILRRRGCKTASKEVTFPTG